MLPHFAGLLLILALLVLCAVRRCYHRKRFQQVRSLLTALHTHPALKAQVEAETGITVPLPPQPRNCMCCVCPSTDELNGTSSSTNSTASRIKAGLVRVLKVLVFAFCLAFVAFWVTVTSLEITMHIVNTMDENAPSDPNSGEVQTTSPAFAVLVLFAVCSVEVLMLSLFARGVKACCTRFGRGCPHYHNHNSTVPTAVTAVTPSAPFEVITNNNHNSSSGSGGMMSSAQRYWSALPAPSSLFTRTSASAVNTEGYPPLLGEDELSTGHSLHGYGYGRSRTAGKTRQEFVCKCSETNLCVLFLIFNVFRCKCCWY